LRRVLRAVGLTGEGEMGERSDEVAEVVLGDLRLRVGRVRVGAVLMLRESLGLTALEASILTCVVVMWFVGGGCVTWFNAGEVSR
jgi:hypothetical protein